MGVSAGGFSPLEALVDGFRLHRALVLAAHGPFTLLNCRLISSACCLRCLWVSAVREGTANCLSGTLVVRNVTLAPSLRV